jgi:hypothetical protein
LPMVASSDLHVRSQLSSWKTVFDCERHPEAIMDAIRKQDLSFKFYKEEGIHAVEPDPADDYLDDSHLPDAV